MPPILAATTGRESSMLARIPSYACEANRDINVAKIASPTEPPVWRSSEFSPVASDNRCRGIELRAIVVSGMKRQLNATPWMIRTFTTSRAPVDSV